MTTMTTPQLETAELLLRRLLCGDSTDRVMAHGEVLNLGLGGLTVADHACADHAGRPALLSLGQMWKHLVRVDSAPHVAARGYRTHTPDNVTFGDRDDAGFGPALGAGGVTGGELL